MNPYSVLGVARDASVEEIRRAYVELARRTHPDRRGNDPDATEQMRHINLAWEMLSDTESRAAVDRRLARGHRSGTSSHAGSPPSGARQTGAGARSRFDPDSGEDFAFDRDDTFNRDDLNASDDFDGDDSALTAGDLPAWMRLGAPAAFVLGIFAVIFGVLVGGFALVRLGLLTLGLSALLFVLSPFVVLVRSRGGSRH